MCKFPRVRNRPMHGAGISYVGLLWSYTSNYSITLIYFLIGWLLQEDISKRKRFNGWHAKSWLSNCCFLPAKQGSVWLNLLNWSDPQKKNNDYYDMVLGALLWLTVPLKTIMKLTCVGPDGLTWAKNQSRSSINHEFHVVTNTNNGWVCCWFLSLLREFFSGSSGFPPSTRTNILNSNGNSGKKRYLVECPLLNSHYLSLLSYYYY